MGAAVAVGATDGLGGAEEAALGIGRGVALGACEGTEGRGVGDSGSSGAAANELATATPASPSTAAPATPATTAADRDRRARPATPRHGGSGARTSLVETKPSPAGECPGVVPGRSAR